MRCRWSGLEDFVKLIKCGRMMSRRMGIFYVVVDKGLPFEDTMWLQMEYKLVVEEESG